MVPTAPRAALAVLSTAPLLWAACGRRVLSSRHAGLLEEGVAGGSAIPEFKHPGVASQVAVGFSEDAGGDASEVVGLCDVREYIDASHGVQAAISRLAEHPGPIAVDCRGEGLGRRGRLSLVQMAVPGFAAAFDVLAIGGDNLFCQGCELGDILRDPAYVKVFFDCRHDVDALDKHFGLRVEGIFDLQIADVVLRGDDRKQQLRRLAGPIHPGSVRGAPQNYINVVKLRGLGEVIDEYAAPDIGGVRKNRPMREISDQLVSKNQQQPWAERPLREELKASAFERAVGIRDLLQRVQQRVDYRERMSEISEASEKFADQFRALRLLPDKRYMEHTFLPLCVLHRVPEVPCDSVRVVCPACRRDLPRSIFSKAKQRSRKFRCDVCRAIDVQAAVQAESESFYYLQARDDGDEDGGRWRVEDVDDARDDEFYDSEYSGYDSFHDDDED